MQTVLSNPSIGRPIVGVLGGMGPAATADLLSKIVARTPVDREQDHLTVSVWSNPATPDRTLALKALGPSPVPAMLDGVRRLQKAGAEIVAIACNTAHAFIRELQTGEPSIQFFDMIGATVDFIVVNWPDVKRVGVLATEGTRLAGLYSAECNRRGLTAIEVDVSDHARLVEPAIAAVKRGLPLGEARRLIAQATRILADREAQVVIAGCTEIPLISSEAASVLPVIDATSCLADAIVAYATADSIGL